jgi:ribosomal protein L31
MRIVNYNDLQYAATKRLAVYCPSGGPGGLKSPKPASFVMNQDVRTINSAINNGLFIYVKENCHPVFFSGPGGALMCDRHIEGLTKAFKRDVDGYENFKFYGGWYIVGESMSIATMKTICKQFNGIWKDVDNEPF